MPENVGTIFETAPGVFSTPSLISECCELEAQGAIKQHASLEAPAANRQIFGKHGLVTFLEVQSPVRGTPIAWHVAVAQSYTVRSFLPFAWRDGPGI